MHIHQHINRPCTQLFFSLNVCSWVFASNATLHLQCWYDFFFMQKCKVRAYVVLCCGPEVCELIGVGVCASVCLCICGFCWVSVATLCFPPVPVCGCNAEWRSFLWSVQGLSMVEGWVEFSRGEGGMFNMGRVLLQSVHPLIWDTHLCLLVF